MTKKEQSEQEEARATLREMFPPGSTVHTVLRHVSRSGMSRSISVLHSDDRGNISDVSWAVARATGNKFDRDRGGVKVGGCGMGMGFAVVYDLSWSLYRDGFGCIGDKCPSDDHSNGDRDHTPHGHRGTRYDATACFNGDKSSLEHWHSKGGYALRHCWV